MADFLPAFTHTLKAEGGYVLTDIPADRGRQTYAGISRKFHPSWAGWSFIDRKEAPPELLVQNLYRDQFWQPIKGDDIVAKSVASTIYDFAVNVGVKTALRNVQETLGISADGLIGPETLSALNQANPEAFRMAYALKKIAHYRDIARKDNTQRVFLLGWINRTLDQLA